MTILLTTHYLEEADRLAARLAIVDRGRVVAEGTPDELKARAARRRRPGRARRAPATAACRDGARPGRRACARSRVDGRIAARPRRRRRARRARRPRRARGAAASRVGLGHRRPALARRRLPPPRRPHVRADAEPRRRIDDRAQHTWYMTVRHVRALLRQPWWIAASPWSSRSSGCSSSARCSSASSRSRASPAAPTSTSSPPGVDRDERALLERLERHGADRRPRPRRASTASSSRPCSRGVADRRPARAGRRSRSSCSRSSSSCWR